MGNTPVNFDKIKVLFLLEAFNKGGIEKVTLDIVNNLDPDKYDITVQTFWYGGHCQSLVNDNVKVIPFFFKRYVKGVIRLIEYLPPRLLHLLFVRDKYDVEIAASDGGAAKVISGSRDKNSKKICWVHMDVIARGSGLKEYKNSKTAKKIYKRFHKIACVSETCMRNFVLKFGNEYPICVVHNPIPINDISLKSKESIDFELPSKINFICVGRLVPQKGFDRLIDVCSKLVEEGYRDFSVNIIGEGICKQELQEQIINCGLSSFITLRGFRNNPYSYIRSSDVFLLSSRDEAHPLVVGESLACGTPVLSTDCCGVSDWLGLSNEYGFIVENSTYGIYHGMKKILDNPELINVMKENISLKYTPPDFYDSLSNFEKLLSDK